MREHRLCMEWDNCDYPMCDLCGNYWPCPEEVKRRETDAE